MQKTIRLMPVLMALAIAVGACVPQQAIKTQSPQEAAAQVATSVAMTMDAQGQIATFVAQTVAAQNTGTAAAQPQFTATLVPAPTSIFPSATPFVVTPSSGGGGGGGGGGGSNPAPTKEQYSCSVESQVPGDGTAFKPGKEINIRWVVKNTGTKTWEPTWSFSFFSGTNFSTTGSYTLGKQVKRNETIALDLDAIVPHGDARYDKPQIIVMKWAIKGEGSRFCTPFVAIKVSLTGE